MRKIFSLKNFKLLTLILTVIAVMAAPLCAFAAPAVPGDVIVLFKNPGTRITAQSAGSGVGRIHAQSVVKALGADIKRTYNALSEEGNAVFALVHSDTKSEEELLKELRARPDVLGAQLNHKIRALALPNDYDSSTLWGLAAINAPAVWDSTTTGADDVYVAVADTGVYYNHQDLSGNFESNGYSRDFTSSYSYSDAHGHGTHVSGTIGAVGNNGIGVVGVNWRTKIISLRVLGSSGYGSSDAEINAINYLVQLLKSNSSLKLAAVNLSLGGYAYTKPSETTSNPEWVALSLLSKMNRAVICVAAGNEAQEVGSPTTSYTEDYYPGMYCYPASFRGIDNMIVVGALDSNYGQASYSNYSTKYVDIAAPGTDIYSTVLYSDYDYYSGTSMATPHVAGAAALLKSAYPSATASQIKKAILSGANSSYGRGFTAYGMLDVNAALSKLKDIIGDSDDDYDDDDDDDDDYVSKPTFTTSSLSSATVGKSYSARINITGRNITKITKSGTVPSGLSITAKRSSSSAYIKISGKPKKAGTSTLKFKAVNSAGSTSKTYKLTVKTATSSKPKITTSSLPAATVSKYYSTKIYATGNNLKFTRTGSLPSGLSMYYTQTGTSSYYVTLYGTPRRAGTFTFKVKAKNSSGTATKTYKLTVKSASSSSSAPRITTSSVASGTVGKYYSAKIYVTGNNSGIKLSWSGSLPGAFNTGYTKLSSSKLYIVLYGTTWTAKTYTFAIKAVNSYGSATKTFRLTIRPSSSYSSNSDSDSDSGKNTENPDSNGLTGDENNNNDNSSGSELLNSAVNAKLTLLNSDDLNIKVAEDDEDLVSTVPGTDLTFKIGEWTDNDGNKLDDIKPDDLHVYINNELSENINIVNSGDINIFEIADVSDDISVYVKAIKADESEKSDKDTSAAENALRSSTVFITTDAAADDSSSKNSSSGGCSALNAGALILLIAMSALKFKKTE